jgi:hypothetical protein
VHGCKCGPESDGKMDRAVAGTMLFAPTWHATSAITGCQTNLHRPEQRPTTTPKVTMSKASRPYRLDLQFRGHVEGLTYIDIDSNPLCHLFSGVPYALPPLGPFRFQKPRSLPSCYRYGTKVNPARFTGGCGLCPQPGFGETSNTEAWDEDCLQSNVWIPAGKSPPKGTSIGMQIPKLYS